MNKKTKGILEVVFAAITAVIVLTSFMGCPASANPPLPPDITTDATIAVTGVSLDRTAVTIEQGTTLQLAATVVPSEASNKEVTWASSDVSIATVNSSGLVTAVSNGSATITVTTKDGSFTDTCAITVGIPVTGVALDKTAGTINAGEVVALTATITPANPTNPDITWSTSDENVATVASSDALTANVTGIADGTAVITVTTLDGGYTADYTVTVNVPVTGVNLNKESTTILTGSTEQLAATVEPAGASNQGVTWSSSDEAVATVNSSGLVTAVADGPAVITVTTDDGSFTDTCNVAATSTAVAVTGITLNKTTAALEKGTTEQLAATISPSGATNQNISWSSTNTDVVTVSTSGLVTAVADGTADITVTTDDGGYTASCTFTVTTSVTGISLNKTTTIINNGLTEQLVAAISPADATNQGVTWSSSNEAVATVNASGLVTGVGNGTADITVTAVDTTNGTITATCNVTVVKPVTSVALNKSETTLEVGDTESLTAAILPADATIQTVTWVSDNPSVATVDSSGLVTALDNGTAVISATADDNSGKTDACTVTVDTKVNGISLTPASITIDASNTTQLTATLLPSNPTNTTVNWTSSDDSIATVDANGLVTGVADGTATITATADDTRNGTFSETCTVTVNVPVTGITLDKWSVDLYHGETYQLNSTVFPAGASDTSVTWSSDSPNIATVDSNGLVTADSSNSGPVMISATTTDGNFTAQCDIYVGSHVTGVQFGEYDGDGNFTDLNTYTIQVNEDLWLDGHVSFDPSDAANRNITCTTTDSSIVSIENSYGESAITGLANGTCTITITTEDGGHTDTFGLTVSADTTPPEPQFMFLNSSSQILYAFNEPVTSASAGAASNYVITNNSASVSSVVVKDSRTVLLTLDKTLTDGETLTLTVSGVEDTAGNIMTPYSENLEFQTPPEFLDPSKITVTNGKISGLAGTAESNTWVDNGQGGLEPTISVFALAHGATISQFNIVAESMILQEGSFPTMQDFDSLPKVFDSGSSYDLYLLEDGQNGMYMSLPYTITIP